LVANQTDSLPQLKSQSHFLCTLVQVVVSEQLVVREQMLLPTLDICIDRMA
jgi:hypothetical protein